ncbi:MAG: periplasmic heavy metal sensor [Bacteroidales bacterium]|nr:periplasmic heavy metal sensor [Bacteroidales bacterium]
MNYFKQNKISTWVIIILLATNISTITTVLYNKNQNKQASQNPEEIIIPDDGLGRFFRDELNLTRDQHQQFRSYRQNYHINASKITGQLHEKRSEMLNELSVENSDTKYLHQIAEEIGDLHKELKHLTFEYYLNLKDICTESQRKKLFSIFNSMQNSEWELKCSKDSLDVPEPGYRKFKNRKNSN